MFGQKFKETEKLSSVERSVHAYTYIVYTYNKY